MFTTYAIIAAISYLLGSIPFGYILVRVFLKQDIRTTGSGNIGATNVGRTGHKGLAIATLLLDAGKGFAAVAMTGAYWSRRFSPPSLPGSVGNGMRWDAMPPGLLGALAFAGMCAIVGHMFPVWLGFKGGKGVATALGAFFVISPFGTLVSLVVFALTLSFTYYVSLGSIVAAAVFPAAAYLLRPSVYGHGEYRWPFFACTIAASLLIIFKHHANIRRLIAGTEPKLGAKAKLPPPQQMGKQA